MEKLRLLVLRKNRRMKVKVGNWFSQSHSSIYWCRGCIVRYGAYVNGLLLLIKIFMKVTYSLLLLLPVRYWSAAAYITIFVKVTFFFRPSFYFAAGHLTGLIVCCCCWLWFFEFECPLADISGPCICRAGSSFVSDLLIDRHPCV